MRPAIDRDGPCQAPGARIGASTGVAAPSIAVVPGCEAAGPVRLASVMAPTLIFDISRFDMGQTLLDVEGIEALNPHRGPMRLIDRVVWRQPEPHRMVAVKAVRDDEFWVPGHIPGRPIFPGVLMIEAAAQVASLMYQFRIREQGGQPRFMGFAGVDEVKFRGQVVPGDTFVLLCEETNFKPRRCICYAQGVVNGSLVFEGRVTGMPI